MSIGTVSCTGGVQCDGAGEGDEGRERSEVLSMGIWGTQMFGGQQDKEGPAGEPEKQRWMR